MSTGTIPNIYIKVGDAETKTRTISFTTEPEELLNSFTMEYELLTASGEAELPNYITPIDSTGTFTITSDGTIPYGTEEFKVKGTLKRPA